MKTKITFTVSVVAALIVGFLIGDFHATRSWVRWHNRSVCGSYAAQTVIYTMTLSSLRSGHVQETINTLENYLDGSLLALDQDYKPFSKRPDDSILSSIKLARDYRAKYPWVDTNAIIEARVQEALAWGK